MPTKTHPKTSPSTPPKISRDPRLVGAWEYSTYSSFGGFSRHYSEFRVMRADGQFIESGGSSFNINYRNWLGDETGRSYANVVAPENRGTWSTDNGTLRLVWDNRYYAVFKYDVGRDGMILTPIDPAGREQKYWQRKG